MTPKLLSLSAISGEEGAGAADNCANEGTVAEDGEAMTDASEGVEALDDTSVKGFGTLYFFPSLIRKEEVRTQQYNSGKETDEFG